MVNTITLSRLINHELKVIIQQIYDDCGTISVHDTEFDDVDTNFEHAVFHDSAILFHSEDKCSIHIHDYLRPFLSRWRDFARFHVDHVFHLFINVRHYALDDDFLLATFLRICSFLYNYYEKQIFYSTYDFLRLFKLQWYRDFNNKRLLYFMFPWLFIMSFVTSTGNSTTGHLFTDVKNTVKKELKYENMYLGASDCDTGNCAIADNWHWLDGHGRLCIVNTWLALFTVLSPYGKISN